MMLTSSLPTCSVFRGSAFRKYREEPDNLTMKLRSDFLAFAADELRRALTADDVDVNTVVAVYGGASLYGFTKVALVLKEVEHSIRGRARMTP